MGFIWLFICAVAACVENARDEGERIKARDLAKAHGKAYYVATYGRMYVGDTRVYRRFVNGREVLTTFWNPNHVLYDLTSEKEAEERRIQHLRELLEAKEAEKRADERAKGHRRCSLTSLTSEFYVYMDTETGEFYTIVTNMDTDTHRYLPYVHLTLERFWNTRTTYRWKCIDSYPISENDARELGGAYEARQAGAALYVPQHIGEIGMQDCEVKWDRLQG